MAEDCRLTENMAATGKVAGQRPRSKAGKLGDISKKGICDALGLSPYFFRIYGANSFSTKKPDPEGLLALIHEAGVTPEETLMIGDSNVDVLTARNAGAWSMGCSFGLAPHTLVSTPPDCLADSPTDWPLVFAGEDQNAVCRN